MKLIDILKTASGNLLHSKLRTFLTVIAIFVGAMTLTLTNGIGSGVSEYIDRQVNSVGAKDVLLIQAKGTQQQEGPPSQGDGPQKYDPEKNTTTTGFGETISVLTNKDLEKIKAHPAIRTIEPLRSVSVDYIKGLNDDKYQISVTSYIDGTNIDRAAGELPNNASTDKQILLPVTYVNVLGFSSPEDAVGKTVKLAVTSATKQQSEVAATVIGVQRKTVIDGGSSNMNRALVTELYKAQSEGLPAAFSEQYYFAAAHFDMGITSDQLQELKNSLDKEGYRAQTVDDQIGIVKAAIGGIVTVLNLFGIIALIAASFGVINTLFMSVQERTKEIGLMKAMGMGKGRIFLLFSTEAILLGFWGSLLGSLAAYGIGQVANQYASNTFLKDFDGMKLLAFPWQSVASIMLVIMVIAFLAGTLPARHAARLNPIDALRYE